MYYQNVRGLRTKSNELLASTHSLEYDIVFLSETWLNDGFLDSEIFDSRFNVFRRDRNYDELDCQRGGGVLIATSNIFQASVVDTPVNLAFEDVWVSLLFNQIKVIICCVYIPPNSSVECYQSFCNTCESLKNRYENCKFIVCGDFNLPNVQWSVEDDTLVPLALNSPSAETVMESMFFLELQQINPHLNSHNRILDLIFADDVFAKSTILLSSNPLVGIDTYHPPIECYFDIYYTPELKNSSTSSYYVFDRVDFSELNKFYGSIDWSFICTTSDIDLAVQKFYEILFEGIDIYVPKRTFKSQKYPCWFDKELRKLIAKKNRLHKKFKRSGSQVDYEAFSSIRREVKFRTDLCYLTFVSRAEHLIPENIKHFWSYMKNLTGVSNLPSIMQFMDQSLNNSHDIADAFASHFQSCYSNHDDVVLTGNCPVEFSSVLSSHIFSNEEISAKLSSLDVSKKAGPDGIPPLLLKSCCTSLVIPLKSLFQKSMDAGYFPLTWKNSNLLPIFKSGDRSIVGNYRGISLLSAIPKLFESVLTDEIFNTYKSYIIPEQHGFFKNRSTCTNLAVYQNFLISSIEAGYQVDSVYTDISKAFDSVCHSLLIKKLSEIGVSGSYIKLIESYLSLRRQRVIVCGSFSRYISVTSGVPQGSHLGPVLFILFINDVISCFRSSQCLLYADDLKLFSTAGPGSVGLQSDLDRFVIWCESNYLSINISKCRSISFYKRRNPLGNTYTIGNTTIERVSSINDLGIIFDTDLTFNSHIDSIVLKGFRMLGFIKRNSKHITDTKAITCLYNCLVRSLLEYCSVIWAPRYDCHIQRVERVQSKFLKYLLYKFHFPHSNIPYDTRLQLCGVNSLECRRRKAYLLFLHKLLNGGIDCTSLLNLIMFLVPTRRTRQTQLFYEQYHRTNYGFNAFVDRLLQNYNKFFPYCDIFSQSLDSVKRMLRDLSL